jgi:hypothetical protein
MRQTKRDIIDKLVKGPLESLMLIYWLYSFYLISKRWEIQTCHDLLGGFADQLTSPAIRSVLLLLEKQDLESVKVKAAAQALENGQASPNANLDYKLVNLKLVTFFGQITQHTPENLELSFEKIADIERNHQEIASIIKTLRSRPSSSGSPR